MTGIGAAAHVTLDMEQLIVHLRVALVNTPSSLSHSERGVIPVSNEVKTKGHIVMPYAQGL